MGTFISLFLYKDHPIISLPSHYRNWGRDKARNIASGVMIRRVKPREFSPFFFFLPLFVSVCLPFLCEPREYIRFALCLLSGEDSHPI